MSTIARRSVMEARTTILESSSYITACSTWGPSVAPDPEC